ncbi:hypothetical protein [Faecalibacter sp. LW9]|uniref:hypothetical protein n=1 Tax=Faecalibacter sp. LW9 TaxID=3103144 RepID=UPI002AFFD56A|nr:hypothetical protein [Faecalibacter sp. LW9]
MIAEVFGITRQGFYKKLKRIKEDEKAQEVIIEKVQNERLLQPNYGAKKITSSATSVLFGESY